MIYEFLKDRHGHRKGVVCAIGNGKVGWSLCNEKGYGTEEGDKFNKKLALEMAEGRAKEYGNIEKYTLCCCAEDDDDYAFVNKVTDRYTSIPNSIEKLFKKMIERSSRYYK